MFEQFRSYFPRGCLISELVQIDHGKYIVRASVQNEGLTLATGLAAADTVEQAEDQARTRALAVLDISLTPAQSNSRSPIAQPQPKENSAQPTTATNSQNKEQSNSSPVPSASATSKASQSPVNTEPEVALSPTETEAVKQQTSSTATKASSSEETQSLAESPQTSVSSSSSDEETTMDYSDIIAKTNVELKRLRWTNEQGRKFLEETYGKRSRSLLSESELLEFLQYLEKQPTPPQPS